MRIGEEGTVPSRVNVYLPDELARAVREAGIAISAVCQAALEQEVRKVQAAKEASSDLEQVAARLRQTRTEAEKRDYAEGFELGVHWAKEEATEAELEWAAETAGEQWVHLSIPGGEHSLLATFDEAFGTESEGPGLGEHLRIERSPWAVGLLEGAREVYRKVIPLL